MLFSNTFPPEVDKHIFLCVLLFVIGFVDLFLMFSFSFTYGLYCIMYEVGIQLQFSLHSESFFPNNMEEKMYYFPGAPG